MKRNNILYKLRHRIMFIIAIGFLFTGCKDKFKPEDSYLKVYDDKDANKNYFPLGIHQTSDQGYLILSAYNGWNIHLLKTDQEGNFLWKYDLPAKYVNAVPHFIERNGNLFFVCMDVVGLFTYIMQVDENGKQATEFNTFQGILYPVSIFDNKSEVYIQNYERTSYEMGVTQLNAEMSQIQNSGSVQIFTDVEDKIVHHINYTGKRYPFFVHVTPEKNHIVMNGFNNYSFSTVFLNMQLNFSGVYNGPAFDGGLNAILPLGGNRFSLARFTFSNMYFNPSSPLIPTAIEIVESIPAESKAELDPQSPVLIKNLTIDSKNYVVFLATTKSNQLMLSFYEEGSSEMKASKYIGQSVPLKACDFSITVDDGLMILAQVSVMGSFNRIATIKLSKEELEDSVD